VLHLPLTRKIPCALGALLLLTVALLAIAPGARAARRPRIEAANVSQAGRSLVLTVRTAKPVALATLAPRPDARRAAASYLCFGFATAGGAKGSAAGAAGSGAAAAAGGNETRLCLGGPKAHKRAGLVTVDSAEKPLARASVPARLKRPRPRELVLSIVAGPTHPSGLRPGRYRWRVLAASGGCEVRRDCATAWPPSGTNAFRLRPVRAVGCTGGDAELVSAAATERKVVALTFDDGPSEYTDRFLDVLREKGVPGTFFEIGQEMPGREATMRRILAEGDEIGDHTMNHVEYPGYGQIARRRAADPVLHRLRAVPLPAPRRRGRLERRRHRRLARAEDDHLGRRPARLVAAGHRRDLRQHRHERETGSDHPHARRRRSS
jgi:hypothetical protein